MTNAFDLPTQRLTVSPDKLLGPLNEVEQKFAPEILFAAGWLSVIEDTPRVAIVGSRKASEEGLKRARRLARLLVAKKVTIVSGLAEGIDTAAHRMAIDSGGRTIAVLGTPLNVAYPAKNRALQREIMEHHLVISQFPPGHPIQRSNFPRRNRTMALIADASVIVEASDSSGSLSQGWEALRLGRPLFMMKALADDKRLKWPAEMQRYGAQVLSDDSFALLLEALPIWAREDVHSLAF